MDGLKHEKEDSENIKNLEDELEKNSNRKQRLMNKTLLMSNYEIINKIIKNQSVDDEFKQIGRDVLLIRIVNHV